MSRLSINSRSSSNTIINIYFVYVLLCLIAFGGWVNNIVIITNMESLTFTGSLILRVVGIVFFPLGVVMGFV